MCPQEASPLLPVSVLCINLKPAGMSPFLRELMFPSSDSGEEKARVPLFPRVRVSGPFGAQRGRDHVHGSGRPAALTGPCRDRLQASSHQPKPWGPGASVPELYWESRQQPPWWLCCLYLFPASLPLASQTGENTISGQNPEDAPTWRRRKGQGGCCFVCFTPDLVRFVCNRGAVSDRCREGEQWQWIQGHWTWRGSQPSVCLRFLLL